MRIKPVMFLIITGVITVVVKKTADKQPSVISVKHFLLAQSLILGHTKKKIKVP